MVLHYFIITAEGDIGLISSLSMDPLKSSQPGQIKICNEKITSLQDVFLCSSISPLMDGMSLFVITRPELCGVTIIRPNA